MTTNIISGHGGGCFKRGTLVLQDKGVYTPIELLAQGDTVVSFNDSGRVKLSKVSKLHHHVDPQKLIKVTFWKGSIVVTPNHWVLNQFGSFVEIGTLTVEDALVDQLGHLRPILSIEVVDSDEVFNLTVEDDHTFIANSIRVHNGGLRTDYPIIGHGGGGKGGGGGAAKEAENTLKASQYADIIDLLGEGEIVGLVDGDKSIYLDGVPLKASDGINNFEDFKYYVRTGTQDQDPVPSALTGTVNTIQNPNASNAITKSYPTAAPQTITVTDNRVKRVDLTVAVQQLTEQNKKNGDLYGSEVSFQISLKTQNGVWQVYKTATIKGKCTSVYQETHEVLVNTTDFPIYIKLERTSDDATSVSISNKLYWYTYTLHIPTILRYPNSALVNITINSEQFTSIPTRGYDVKGLKIRVPTNYNPDTRVYTGTWDGTFKIAWTDNPVWVFYDLIVEPRYGMGEYLKDYQVDKWALYSIAQYCDQLVPNGFGGTEPRFTCNLYIYTQEEAFKVITSIASIFRAMQYWALSQFSLNADMPKDPVAQFTPSNVLNGAFSYAGSSAKTRHTVALVTWNDPDNMYKQKIEYVEDYEGVSRYGIIQTDVIALGCTSQGQAHRLGKWLLYTEQMETETVTFDVSIENALLMPGEVIQTTDPFRSGARMGGRAKSVISQSTIELDSTGDTILTDGEYMISLFVPDITTTYDAVLGTNTSSRNPKLEIREGTILNNIFYAYTPFSTMPNPDAVWVASATAVREPEYWRIVSIVEGDAGTGTATITALEYRKDKYAFVENDIVLEARPTSTINAEKPEPPYIPAESYGSYFHEYMFYSAPSVFSTAAFISWAGTTSSYIVRWSRDNITWEQKEVFQPSIDIKPIGLGTCYIEIRGKNYLGRLSNTLSLTVEVLGKLALPQDVKNLTVDKTDKGLVIDWESNDDPDQFTYPDLDIAGYEIRQLATTITLDPTTKLVGDRVVWKTAEELGKTVPEYEAYLNTRWNSVSVNKIQKSLIPSSNYLDVRAERGYNTYLVKAVDTSGKYSKLPALIGVEIGVPGTISSASVTKRIEGQDLLVNWVKPASDNLIDRYEVDIDNQIFIVYTEEFRRKCWFVGSEPMIITPIDIYENKGLPLTISIDIVNPSTLPPIGLTHTLVDDINTAVVKKDSFKLTWQTNNGTGLVLPIIEYEVRTNLNWGTTSGLLDKSYTNSFVSKVTWNGAKTIYVAGRNSAGVIGAYDSEVITITGAGAPASVTNKVVDNNVLIYWGTPTTGSLPIESYIIKKGSSFATAEVIGNKSGNFTSIFETTAGTYTYWVAPIDSAGVIGTPAQTVAAVSQPPDYVMRSNIDSVFAISGSTIAVTMVNAGTDSNNNLLLPINTTDTWSTHYTGNSWTTIDNQVNAGFPIYVQPQKASGSYTELIDYGTTIAGSSITVSLGYSTVVAGWAATYLMEVSSDNINWTTVSTTKVGYASNFRYLRFTLNIVGGIINISTLNFKLDSKLKTQSGSLVIPANSTTGAIVYLTDNLLSTGTKNFIDVQSIILSTGLIASRQAIAIYDFTDVANPLSFKIYVYDSLTGAIMNVDVKCSYTVRGV